MPVTQPDAWQYPPFEAQLVEQAPYKKVLIGRGATNSKGPQMAQLNAFRAIKAVHGKLPVNLIVVAEGDEERMDIGLRKWVKDHPELLEGADAMMRFGGQSPSGGGGYGGGSEGCVYVELTTSGTAWGRGPDGVGHPRQQQARHRQPGLAPHQDAGLARERRRQHAEDRRLLRRHPAAHAASRRRACAPAAKNMDLKVAAENLGVARFMYDDPYQVLKTQRYGTSFNLDGIWGGNMYAGGAGAILPNKITSKHNFRYVPNMNGPGHREEAAGAARQERLQGRRGEAHRRRAVGAHELRQRDRPRHAAHLRDHEHPARRRCAPTGASAAAARRPAATGRPTCSATAKWARRSRPSRACRS